MIISSVVVVFIASHVQTTKFIKDILVLVVVGGYVRDVFCTVMDDRSQGTTKGNWVPFERRRVESSISSSAHFQRFWKLRLGLCSTLVVRSSTGVVLCSTE